MKVVKKVLMVICILVIIAGIFMLWKNGLNYADGYTQNALLETAKQYIAFIAISTVIILIYFMIRYSKKGAVKVFTTSILGMVGALALVLSIIAITRMQVTRIVFPIMLATYVSSFIVLSAKFEENT